jgi:hypothetical protein
MLEYDYYIYLSENEVFSEHFLKMNLKSDSQLKDSFTKIERI